MTSIKWKHLFLLSLAAIIAFITWLSFSESNQAIYLKRFFLWNFSDIKDYEKFPSIEIENAPPAFHFNNSGNQISIGDIRFSSNGKEKIAHIDTIHAKNGTTAFIILKNDTLLYEKYYNGYQRNSINTSFSTAKSFTSALVGIALEQGHIISLQDKVSDYLPELEPYGYDHLSIEHLLTMASGVPYKSTMIFGDEVDLWWDPRPKVYYYPDLRELITQTVVDTTIVNDYYYYNDYYPVICGLILEKTTGKNPARLLEENIWQHIGAEFPASWSIDSREARTVKMESGINARAIDFAKFGLLILNKGNWKGRQLIPENWVEVSTSPDPTDKRPWKSSLKKRKKDFYYKYFWWGQQRDDGYSFILASGHLGQYIAIFPQQQLVICRFGKSRGKVDFWPDVFVEVAKKLQ